ncbi:MAG TPA: glycine zipper 2TM domain-containing protein [Steroidobacteraceae bacterium]|nr:glycine zipper 2TM domain-containing protein [Steroidobacteraceae bacterium]
MSASRLGLLFPATALLMLGACSKSTPPSSDASPAGAPAAQASAEDLAAREAELKKREEELASREAALASAQAQGARQTPVASAPRPAPKPAPAPVASKPAPAPAAAKPAPAPAPTPVVVPAGTQLSLALTEEVTTKTAKVGDTIRATVVSDVRVDGKVAIAAGTTVAGQVTDVVSGSDKIGGVPRLGLSFDRLELPGNRDVPISGEITQRGKSDTARDAVKIVGGAAAGAILGHQVKGGDKGKVIGGLLGGAIGAVAAQKTGTEVKLAAGTELAIALAAPVEIPR